jgi:putative tricarboxylic transport membrane protein
VLARAVPLILLVAAGVYLTLALRLPFGAAARPGAGFYPVIVAVFAIVVALAATASAFRGAPGAAALELDAAQRRRVVISVVALVAFCLVLPWVGYPVAAFAFVTVVLRYLGGRWTTALLTGALSAAGSYIIFAVLLDVPLPRGPW